MAKRYTKNIRSAVGTPTASTVIDYEERKQQQAIYEQESEGLKPIRFFRRIPTGYRILRSYAYTQRWQTEREIRRLRTLGIPAIGIKRPYKYTVGVPVLYQMN